MRKKKLAGLLAAIMMGLTACPSAPAYAMAQEPAQALAQVETQEPEENREEEASPGTGEENPASSQAGATNNENGDVKTTDAENALPDMLPLPPQLLSALFGEMDEETLALLLAHPDLLALFLPSLSVTVSNQAVTIRFRNGEAKDGDKETSPYEKGTVRTQGYNLHVRTGAGLDHEIITKLPDGSEVKVLGEENGWYHVEIPARYGYVFGEYLETSQVVPDRVTEEGTTFEISGEQILSLLQLFTRSGREETDAAALEGSLTPSGNLTLVDDYGEKTGEGRQFVTVMTKNGNYFYLVIDRNEDGEENVHFLNLVDERDLLTLMEEDEAATYEKQQEAARKAAEEVLKEAEEKARREAAQALEETETEVPKNQQTGMLAAVAGIAVLAGACIWMFRRRRKDSGKKRDPDFGEDDFEREMEEDLYEEQTEEESL